MWHRWEWSFNGVSLALECSLKEFYSWLLFAWGDGTFGFLWSWNWLGAFLCFCHLGLFVYDLKCDYEMGVVVS